mgnify:CR=1 FL=1
MSENNNKFKNQSVLEEKYKDGTKTEKILKKAGKKNITIGIFIVLGGAAFLIIQLIFWAELKKTRLITSILAIITGFSFIGKGLKQRNLDGSEKSKLNKAMYGAEEPEEKWNCPKCEAENLNTTSRCKKCGYSIF